MSSVEIDPSPNVQKAFRGPVPSAFASKETTRGAEPESGVAVGATVTGAQGVIVNDSVVVPHPFVAVTVAVKIPPVV